MWFNANNRRAWHGKIAFPDDIQELLDRVADGNGYGDLEARLNDDRKLQVLLAREQSKVGAKLNQLTFFMVVVGLLKGPVP
jgi:hypothetical protein